MNVPRLVVCAWPGFNDKQAMGSLVVPPWVLVFSGPGLGPLGLTVADNLII